MFYQTLTVRSTVSFKFEKSHQVINLLQALGDFESKSKSLKIISKENTVVYISEIFKFFSPLLTNILETRTLNQETVILVPDISTLAIVKLHDLVSTGNVIDVIQSSDRDRRNIISEIVDVAELFDIKIKPTSISSERKECLDSEDKNVKPEYNELPTHPLNEHHAERDTKVNDLTKEKENYKVEENEEIVNEELRIADVPGFESSKNFAFYDYVNHEYSLNCNNKSNSSSPVSIRSSKELVTVIGCIEDAESKAEVEETAESVQSFFSNDPNEGSTVHYEIDEVPLDRFDMTAEQLFKEIERSCKSCHFKTRSKKKLKNHVESEHDYVIFLCSNCNFQTRSKEKLKSHVESEHDYVIFFCSNCNFQTKSKYYLKQHVQEVHEDVQYDVRYFCESCSYETKRKCKLMMHVQAEHEDVLYSCESCSYHSNVKSHLKRH